MDEVASRRYVCTACGAPRPLLPGTAVQTGFEERQAKRARRLHLWSALARAAGWGALALGVGVSTLVMLFFAGGYGFLPLGLSLVPFFAGVVGGTRLRAQAKALEQDVLDGRLLAQAAEHRAGVSPERAARALSLSEAAVDARLTQLAKAGHLALDVTDHGELRYRVASEEEEGGTADVAARLDALGQGDERQ